MHHTAVTAADVDASLGFHGGIPGSDHVLQLFQFPVPCIPPVARRMLAPGSAHIAIIVMGRRELMHRSAAVGFEPPVPPGVITPGASTGRTLACMGDPDGVIVEVFEAPAAPSA